MGLDHGIRLAGSHDDIVTWRKNYVIREWFRHNLTGFNDNGETPITPEDIDQAIQALHGWLAGTTWPVETPDCWYKDMGVNVHPDERKELDWQALEALHGLEDCRQHTGKLEYWEWY